MEKKSESERGIDVSVRWDRMRECERVEREIKSEKYKVCGMGLDAENWDPEQKTGSSREIVGDRERERVCGRLSRADMVCHG